MAERRWPARWGTVRVRTTVAAVAVVGVALMLGALVLVLGMRAALTEEVRRSAELRAADVAAQLRTLTRPADLDVTDQPDVLIQVLDDRGRVVAASRNLAGSAAIARLEPGQRAEIGTPADDGRFLAVAAGADTPGGRHTVIAARSLENVDDSTQVVAGLLAAGLPVLLVVVGGTGWLVVGRALRPVDAIRSEVDGISSAELHRRVPVPPGGDELARLAVTMNRMLNRLQSAQARQRRFISDASHELRSPVASIRQHAEVAAAHPGNTTVAELAGTVLADDLRVQHLVEDLLLLARADEHTLELRRRPVDVDDLVFEEAGRLRRSTPARVDVAGVLAGRVDGDRAALRRVLRNLGDNAARHARSRIAFSLAERDGRVILGVEDDGPGVPEPDRERVFERFVRLDEARARDAGGSGLGLAIVAEVVAGHHGTVAMTASPLGGVRVELTMPVLAD